MTDKRVEEICDQHDLDYHCDAPRIFKLWYDFLFFFRLLKHGLWCIVKGLWFVIYAIGAYLMVSIFGWLFFNN